SFARVLFAGSLWRDAIASSRTERTTSSFASVMSLPTPDVENAAGIVSRLSHAPLANAKKSRHAWAVVSINEGSKTLSTGGIGTAELAVVACARSEGAPIPAAIMVSVSVDTKRTLAMCMATAEMRLFGIAELFGGRRIIRIS